MQIMYTVLSTIDYYLIHLSPLSSLSTTCSGVFYGSNYSCNSVSIHFSFIHTNEVFNPLKPRERERERDMGRIDKE
jgi:hypothetical protein